MEHKVFYMTCTLKIKDFYFQEQYEMSQGRAGRTVELEIHAFFISNTFTGNVRLKLSKYQASTKQHPEV